ncbi:DNA polymerase IV [Treponema endosymbiont of Eucomonympha sp.]|uniref:DNA polymerase IV n=1 Tax=Treponema endosymbiont of Eucomonympha sp. TaxID=1580831 RepID=UPI000A4974DD|nr:DNA polymerase IV [Treponema endosymbiont of Eucomonympha sp.]
MSHILHVDIDAFYASVEQLDAPEYRGKPVIVGGLPGDRRSVVSTCSYEARRFGVHAAMPVAEAYRLCPEGIFLRVRMRRYLEKSAEALAVFGEFSPDVRQISIDEAFVDLTGTERLFGAPEEAARKLKRAVRERTGLTVSVGLAPNKYVAKIASGMSKPDGFYAVPAGGEEAFALALPLEKLWGVGDKTRERLKAAGFRTARDVHRASRSALVSLLGEAGGAFLYRAVRGEAAESFGGERKSRSLSAETTFGYDQTDLSALETCLLELCHTVVFRLLSSGKTSKAVCLKIRYADFSTESVQETSAREISSVDALYERVAALFGRKYRRGAGVRLLGVGALNVTDAAAPEQGELFDFGEQKRRDVEKAILSLRAPGDSSCRQATNTPAPIPSAPAATAAPVKNLFAAFIFCLQYV